MLRSWGFTDITTRDSGLIMEDRGWIGGVGLFCQPVGPSSPSSKDPNLSEQHFSGTMCSSLSLSQKSHPLLMRVFLTSSQAQKQARHRYKLTKACRTSLP